MTREVIESKRKNIVLYVILFVSLGIAILPILSLVFPALYWYLAIYIGVFLSLQIVSFFINWYLGIIGINATYRLRMDIFKKIQNHSLDYFDRTPKGDIISRFNNDVNSLNPILSGSVIFGFISIINLIIVGVIMYSISPILTLFTFLFVPFTFIIPVLGKKYTRPRLATVYEDLAEVSSVMTENIMGARVSLTYSRA